ncbi:non-ribosomal peptide synthetase [Sodiomyces alkalinus F11]|uniref:Non-ribosomal peptide synthetase n=1 Tax=Sodiomyces alkalinus (strain CBS 110278 / VKM F-3762 / F11) TaxID=1314773 RepID=A0A3N2PLG3_SODAK|nr:non-ribosomal peptide synthetase [Sodiomyces alkalinus F11]ROT35186.1 non-ribosomal peptide synthetase [Sodiomyces alkalinus F11]
MEPASSVRNTSTGRVMPPDSFVFGPQAHPKFDTVTAAFFHQATAHPDVVAARDLSARPPREITYSDLARRSARLSHRLRQLGVVPGDRVPLVVKRGIDMLVGIVAILTCGAQYVPLDGGVVPDSSLRFALEQAGGHTVLALRSTRHRLLDTGVRNVLAIDEPEGVEQDLPEMHTTPQNLATPDNGCYIIYTSGTTGTPKGVDVTHRNVTNLICLSPGNLGITSGSRVGQILNISFDMAAWEMLGSLCNGGTLILRGSNWAEALQQMDVLICTPSILAKYNPQDYPSIRTVATAGEPSSQRLADTWATHGTYYNCCGPTETTIVNTMHPHVPGQPLSIGKPTPNNNVYILSEDGVPVAVGEPGVMWAGGLGVTRGYVKLPEKTAEKYLPDPFKNDGSMMYNTGDLCRWMPDGTIDILGRADDQIKIKGFRVELDGVTASMNSCPAVGRAAALLIGDAIHGFVTPEHCDLDVLREHVKGRQPYYAVPSEFHRLAALPLTPNGKIDKKALKEIAAVPAQDDTATICEKASAKSIHSKITMVEKTRDRAESSASSMTEVDSSASSVAEVDSSASSMTEKVDLDDDIPDKKRRQPFRGLWHRVLIVYRRLFTLVGLFNIAAAVALVLTGVQREWLSTLTAINLVTAVLIRQDFVINALYTITCSVPTSWPLFIRKRCAKIYHLGGVHSGAAVCAGLWLLAANVSDEVCLFTQCNANGWDKASLAAKVISWMLSGLFVVMFALAYPSIRKHYHNLFEKTHRFVGWTMLGLFWVQVVLAANDTRGDLRLGAACIRSPPFWLLVVATLSIASSWFFLRKVPVDAEVLSNHAVRLHFDYTVPVNGSFMRLSHRPLLEWHSFATIPAPEAVHGRPKGYSLVVSAAGDWTKACIEKPPSHVWVRGVPVCGVMRILTLFNRVVLIATGSGIGPMLGHIQDPSCEMRLIWSTPRPEVTFGEKFVATIRRHSPDAVIHDTKALGRPDLVRMGYNLAKSIKAEAVIIIANEKITKKVVYGLETRGVSAYGAIWDS